MHDTICTLADFDSNLIPVIAMSIGGGIAIIAIVFGAIRQVIETFAKEKTRREISAYVAEGSITPEEGERLLKAGRENSKKCC